MYSIKFHTGKGGSARGWGINPYSFHISTFTKLVIPFHILYIKQTIVPVSYTCFSISP